MLPDGPVAPASMLQFAGCGVSLFGKVLVNVLEKKKLLSKEDAKKAKDELEDLTDDGKKNGSNKGD